MGPVSVLELSAWVEEFRSLHEGARGGRLASPHVEVYRAARDGLARLILSAQQIALLPGQRPRRALRASRALQADIEFEDGVLRAKTFQVSSGGFAALLVKGPRVGEQVDVALGLPGREALHAGARVVSVKEHLGNASTSFEFLGLEADAAEQIELVVFDALLEKLKGWAPDAPC